MPWDEDRSASPVGIHDGVVYFNGEPPADGRAGFGSSVGWRWIPGTAAPEPVGGWIGTVDASSGTMLVTNKDGRFVVTADGERHLIDLDPAATLRPGGDLLYTFRNEPCAVTLFGLTTGAASPRVVSLPPGCRFGAPHPPVWEEPDHLLISTRDNFRLPGVGVRADLTSGRLELLDLDHAGGHDSVFVEPWLGAGREA